MKPLPISLALALTAAAALWLRADDGNGVLPKGPPAARYDAMAARSPFTAPTAAAPVSTPPPVAGPHWWDQMFLTSLMDRGGVYYVGLWDKASSKHYLLQTGKADQDSQLLLSSVQWNDHLDQTTATVSKGSDTAPPIRFDASAASAAPVAQGPTTSFAPSGPRPLPNALPPTLPPGFTGTPPPPPPTSNSVVRRVGPIASRPGSQPQPDARQPATGMPRRIVVPNGEDN